MIEFSTYREPKAKKTHVCSLCGGAINVGEKYVRFSGKDGKFMFDTKLHLPCSVLIEKYCENIEQNEYDNDAVIDWVKKIACSGCKYFEDDNDDPPCNASIFECDRVRNYFKTE